MKNDALIPGYYVARGDGPSVWDTDYICDTETAHIGGADRLEEAVLLAKKDQANTGRLGVIWIDDDRLEAKPDK